MVSAPARREQVAHARHGGLSGRFACALVQVSRSTLGYESRMERRDAPLIDRMKALALENNRYGYRSVRVLLGREGIGLSWARAHRLWREAGRDAPIPLSHDDRKALALAFRLQHPAPAGSVTPTAPASSPPWHPLA